MIFRGILLFLFIPLVLVLYLAQPLGTLPSLAAGVVIMLGHRFIARPFSEGNRMRRCLWCGRRLRMARVHLEVTGPRGDETRYWFCAPSDRTCRSNWFGLHTLAARYALPLRLGILAPVLLYLVSETARGVGLPAVSHAVAAGIFRGVVAAAVVTVSFAFAALRPEEDPTEGPAGRFPFPLHNLTLLGAGWTLWVFRVVGAWWLLDLGRRLLEALI